MRAGLASSSPGLVARARSGLAQLPLTARVSTSSDSDAADRSRESDREEGSITAVESSESVAGSGAVATGTEVSASR